MRLLLDMGAAPRTAAFLREHGHDAIHLREQHLQRLADEDIVRKAAGERRILVTFDLDFSRLLALQRLSQPSMILFRLDAFTTDQLNTLLLDILAVHDRELEQGAIVVVEATGFRVRSLPIWQT
jgi:predicted nuclease of predicted toxin-antitoxin system